MADSNPYKMTLLLASKQACIILSEIQKFLGKSVAESQPTMQLIKAIADYEKWEKEHP